MITLGGSGSSDPDGNNDEMLYHWQQLHTVTARFISHPGITDAEVSFRAPAVRDPATFRSKITTERIRLFVTDEGGLTGYDEITVEVHPR